MATAKQLAANRANALRSTGPKTEEGKRVSSQNALKHGFAGFSILIEEEDREAYDQHLDAYFSRFKPVEQVEADTVRHAANSRWKYDRLCLIEATLIEWESQMQMPRADSVMEHIEPRHAWTLGFKIQCEERALETCRRYQATHLREFERAIQMFYRLKKERDNDLVAAAPIPEPAPEPKPAGNNKPAPASTRNELPRETQNPASAAPKTVSNPVNKPAKDPVQPPNMPKAA